VPWAENALLETSNLLFKLIWRKLEMALSSHHVVLVIPNKTRTRGDGKVVINTVLIRWVPPKRQCD